MRAFWSSLVLASGRYKGNPMMAHFRLLPRIGAQHFERWLSLWRQTTAELFPQHVAENFVWRAENMAERVLSVIEHHHAQLANQQS
jgi:hemoglobin